MKKVDIVILGAGISGIGASMKYPYAAMFEKTNDFGGLCKSFVVNGFTFDMAVHLSFTDNKIVRDFFDRTDFIRHEPLAMNYYNGFWLKHPIQNNLYPLPMEEKKLIIKSFKNRKDDIIVNYRDWLYAQYGEYFTNNFVNKYTRKYWCRENQELTIDWIGNRMYKPSFEEILIGAMEEETPNTYYATEMRYPKVGGFVSFLKPLIDYKKIFYNYEAQSIDLDRNLISFTNGDSIEFEHLISSLPLPVLISKIKNVPEKIRNVADALNYTSIYLVSIGFNKILEFPSLWFYVYDENILFARAYSPSMKAKNNVPLGKSSIQLEIYFDRNKIKNTDKDYIIESSISALEKMHISNKNDIEVIDFRIIEYANVIFDENMKKNKEEILKYLQNYSNCISTIGRFGRWEYLWSDQSFLSGYQLEIK